MRAYRDEKDIERLMWLRFNYYNIKNMWFVRLNLISHDNEDSCLIKNVYISFYLYLI